MGCSVSLSKYARHLLGNNAGATPSIISTKPKANNNVSVTNHLQAIYLVNFIYKKTSNLAGFLSK